jgi:hypothetical protein
MQFFSGNRFFKVQFGHVSLFVLLLAGNVAGSHEVHPVDAAVGYPGAWNNYHNRWDLVNGVGVCEPISACYVANESHPVEFREPTGDNVTFENQEFYSETGLFMSLSGESGPTTYTVRPDYSYTGRHYEFSATTYVPSAECVAQAKASSVAWRNVTFWFEGLRNGAWSILPINWDSRAINNGSYWGYSSGGHRADNITFSLADEFPSELQWIGGYANKTFKDSWDIQYQDWGRFFLGGFKVSLESGELGHNAHGVEHGIDPGVEPFKIVVDGPSQCADPLAFADAKFKTIGVHYCDYHPDDQCRCHGQCGGDDPQPAPAPAPTTAPSFTALGDAHFFGPHGDRTDFKGRNNTYYNVLSTNNLSANVLFVHDTYNWRNKLVFGSWMKALAVTAVTAENKLVKAAYHCERSAAMDVHFEGEAEPTVVAIGSHIILAQVKVSLSDKFVFAVSNGEWEVEAKNSYLPYKSSNAQKKRLDINLKTLSNVDQNPVAPHGLIGQAWDRDDMMVFGALDDYTTADHVIETKANAEGAIEGSAVDYEINALDPYSTKFKYSRFGLEYAPPRDVSLLSGKKYPTKKTASSAGAMNDEDNDTA